jgi:hypothetical protein
VKEINKKIDKAVAFAVLLLGNSGRAATEVTRESQRSMSPILQAASRGRKKVAATVLALLPQLSFVRVTPPEVLATWIAATHE